MKTGNRVVTSVHVLKTLAHCIMGKGNVVHSKEPIEKIVSKMKVVDI